jgi:hypothetical protein
MIFIWIKSWFDPECVWEYGTCGEGVARRHRIKGNVQFVIWRAGEQGHDKDCWINFDSSWWSLFKPDVV